MVYVSSIHRSLKMEITLKRLKEDLQKIGLKKNYIVGVHSSLKSIGYVINGAQTVIDALLETVRKEGTILMPTFTDCTLASNNPPFSLHDTPSRTGLITETFRKRKEALRSYHPTHSVAAIGKEAEYLTSSHNNTSALGINSPFHKLALKGGYILLIGVDHRTSSLIHVSEALVKLPYLNIPVYGGDKARVLKGNAEIEIVSLKETPGDSRGFIKLDPFLRQKNIIQDGYIGLARSYFMRAKDVLDVACELLTKDPLFLLCEYEDCEACVKRRKYHNALL